ncbi:MAG: 3-phosphoshikimate 1-carboxyvinyltransferase [Deltaproteobacteria bacterium]|nr:3-phosphoshikimate 1-carboxyvinyltransferase [Deltaproteobacteria bacterium]
MPLSLPAPGSKSMTQRALVIAALADGPTRIARPLDCDDSRHLVAALRQLGCAAQWSTEAAEVVPGPLRAGPQRLDCGLAGTAARFLAPFALLRDGPLVIDGGARLCERPIGPLCDALGALGVRSRYLGRPGCPPVELVRDQPAQAAVRIDASVSSQFASGLLLVAPRLPRGLRLELGGAAVSRPYVRMTTRMMEAAGARLRWLGDGSVQVEPGGYRACGTGREIAIEPDWSAAAFLLAAGWLTGLDVLVPDLLPPERSLQGDAAFAAMLRELGRPGAHELDLGGTPDLIAPLCAACLFAAGPSRIAGVAHARIKESDRIGVLARELGKLGARVGVHDDGLEIAPLGSAVRADVTLEPDGDHRMAMAFGLLTLRLAGLRVAEPECVAKSFPDFWMVLERVRAATAAT